MKSIILAVDDIRAIVKRVGRNALMDELILRMTRAFEDYSTEKIKIPMRDGFQYTHPVLGLLEWMPIMEIGQKSTIKIVGYHPHNPNRHQLPTIISTISAFDASTGHLIGLADATFTTALRTGAASALASRLMAKPDSKTLGLIGCGAQAVTQLHALSRIFDFDRVLLHDSDFSVVQSFKERAAFIGIETQPTQLDELVKQSDIVCTATSVEIGEGPVFDAKEYNPWLHVNAVGADFPGKVEVPEDFLKASYVSPDYREQAIKEGECQQLEDAEIGAELVEILQNPDEFKHLKDQPTVFDSTGWALEDQVALEMLLDMAKDFGLGTELDLESISDDPHNPYSFVGDEESVSKNQKAS